MARFPRLLIASVSDVHEPAHCTLALIAALRSHGLHVQHFRSLAAFTPVDYVTPLTGLASRHLDPWIMSAALCRELFVHGAAQADISIIEGCAPYHADLAKLRGWPDIAELLNCPVIGIVPSEPGNAFHAQPIPPQVDALFIDQFASREKFHTQKAVLEEIYRKPVLGGLAAIEPAGDSIERMQRGRPVSGALLDVFSRRLHEVTDMQRVLSLARSRSLSVRPPELLRGQATRRTTRVAIAYDDCFHCYFPETLDALEFLGAELCEFSPLTDECLPDGSDIVYLGCGHPQTHTAALAENECMRAALRQHVCAGKRVYAEGGGAAYLCQHLLIAGSTVPMVGVFSADAEFTDRPLPRPQPVELVCERGSWIAGPGDTVRGYRTGAWRLRPRCDHPTCFKSDWESPEVLVRHHCIGSTVHLNFAAQPRVLEAFFATHAPSLSL
jgi:cobyrinic acid a,c-diamide synthase